MEETDDEQQQISEERDRSPKNVNVPCISEMTSQQRFEWRQHECLCEKAGPRAGEFLLGWGSQYGKVASMAGVKKVKVSEELQ